MGRLSRLWNRVTSRSAPAPAAQRPYQDRRCMNEDWKRGDLAVCISTSGFTPSSAFDPRRDQLLRVADVAEAFAIAAPILIIGLAFEGLPPDVYYQCTSFRKVRPAAEAADADFAADIKRRTQPKVDA